MSRRMTWMWAGMLMAGGVLAIALIFEGPAMMASAGLVEKEPVMVFVIPSLENARRVRSAVSEDRIAWEGRPGLALEGGRVVAMSLDDASAVIEGAGWVDRPIQIVRLDDPATEAGEEAEGDPAEREARAERLRALVNKPTLSRGEQMFVLAAMNDGIEL